LSLIKHITLFVAVSMSITATLPSDIENILNKSKVNKDNVAILVTNINNGEVVASLNPYKEFTPASVAKLATCYSALLELGKNFRWPTQIFYKGYIKNGTLYGDIIIKAYGDPSLSSSDVRRFAKKIASYGISKITGDMIIDRSFFQNSKTISSGFDKNFVSQYNSMPDCMMLNKHLNFIKVNPTPKGIEVYRPYEDRSFQVINNIKAVNGKCRGKNAWPKIKFLKNGDSIAVKLEGTLSKNCRPFSIGKVLSPSYKSFYYIFKHFLKENNIAFNGKLKVQKKPADAKLFFTHFSKPLSSLIAHTLKKSDNLYARHIFLLLGAKRYGEPATIQKGQMAVREILGSRDLISSNDIIVNGSGLSRKSRLSAITLHKILNDAYKNYGKEWMHMLSIAGVDGTLKKRFAHSIVKNKAFMKTGTLKKAKNIAGYVYGNSGNLYNTIILYNGAQIWLGKDIQDKIITEIVKRR